MPNLSWYPDGITRLEAYRRLLARDTARAMSRSRAWTIARLRAAWAAWRAFWQERRA